MARRNEVVIKIVGDAKSLGGALGSAQGMLGGFAKAGLAAGAAVAAGVGVAGFALFQIGDTFHDATNTIITGTGASGDALADLEQSFKDVFANVPADADTVANAIADLNTRLEITGEPLENLATKFVELSRITGTDVQGNIAAVSRVFGDWAIDTEDQALALDTLFKASQLTGIGVDDLSGKIVQFGAPLRQIGFTFEESTALFAKWEKEGVNAEAVAAGLKIGLGKMAKAGEEPIETFSRLVDQIAEAETMGDALSISAEAFGTRAGPDMAAAIREGRFELDDLVTALGDSEGALDDAADRTKGVSEKFTEMKNKIMVALEPLASAVFDKVGEAMDWFGDEVLPDLIAGFQEISAWWDSHGPGIKATAMDIFGRIRDVIRTVVDFVETNWPKVVDGFRDFVDYVKTNVLPVVKDIADKLQTNLGPIIQQVADTVIPLVQDISRSIQDAFQNVVDWVDANWPKIQETISTVVGLIRDTVETFLGWLQWFWNAAGDNILNQVMIVWDWIKQTIGAAMELIQGVIELVMGIITLDWDQAWTGIKNILSGVWDGITAAIDLGVGMIREILAGIANLLWDLLGVPFEDAKQWAEDAAASIVTFFTDMPDKLAGIGTSIADAIVGALKTAWNAAVQTINDLIPNSVGLGIGPSIDLPDNPLPTLHQGGLVPGTPGEEVLAVLQAGERVVPGVAAAAGQGMGGVTVHVGNVTIHANSEAEGRQAARGFTKELRRLAQEAF